jgi:hypothetical protein
LRMSDPEPHRNHIIAGIPKGSNIRKSVRWKGMRMLEPEHQP